MEIIKIITGSANDISVVDEKGMIENVVIQGLKCGNIEDILNISAVNISIYLFCDMA